MKILQICFRMPFPPKDGGAIAMYNMSSGLIKKGCKLTLLVPLTPKHKPALDEMPDEWKDKVRLITKEINTSITLWGAFLNLFSLKPYYVSRYEDNVFRNVLEELLINEDFDLIIVESIKMSMYAESIRKHSNAKLVLRSHNIEHLIWSRVATSSPWGLKKIYLKMLARQLRKYEKTWSQKYDALLAITNVDASYFHKNLYNKNIHITPSGIMFNDMEKYNVVMEENSIFHLGALDWLPNLEGIDWFLKDVWPQIHAAFPQLKFYIAGRNTPPHIQNLKKQNVIIVGEVDDAMLFMQSKQIMIVPLLSGSGMRIKVAEGMALGKVIISTGVGAEGIPYTDGKDILIANTPKDFNRQLAAVIHDDSFAASLSHEAIKTAREKLDNDQIMEDLMDFCRQLQKG